VLNPGLFFLTRAHKSGGSDANEFILSRGMHSLSECVLLQTSLSTPSTKGANAAAVAYFAPKLSPPNSRQTTLP
jgi:hypothetical protein